MKTAMIQTRVDADLKKNAEEVLSSIGMDMTSAIRLFLTQVVNYKCIPFNLRTEQSAASFIAAEPAATYATAAPVFSNANIQKIVRTKNAAGVSKLVGIVQLSEEDIKNDERLAYLLSK